MEIGSEMAGKSNKGRNRRGSNNSVNSSESVVSSTAPVKDDLTAAESGKADANGAPAVSEPINAMQDGKESETANSVNGTKQGKVVFSLFYCTLIRTNMVFSFNSSLL